MSGPDEPRPHVDAPPEPEPVSPSAPVVSNNSPDESRESDFLDRLDNSLDPEADDRRTMERLNHPFIRWVIISLLALMFMIFGIYTAAFIFRIPIPEPEVLKTFIRAIVSIMKLFAP